MIYLYCIPCLAVRNDIQCNNVISKFLGILESGMF